MICRCPNHLSAATWPTHTHSLVFAPERSCAAASVTRKCGSLPWHGAQKNVLWNLRDDASQFLRPHAAAGAGSVERPVSHSARPRGSSGSMRPVSRGEARATGVPGRQSVLHPALCVLRGSALPLGDHQGHCRGAAPGLGRGQGAGQAVHARAAPARRHARTEGDRHRRDLDPQAVIPTASSSATWSVAARSGSAARIARKRAWTSFIDFSGKRRPKRSAWP